MKKKGLHSIIFLVFLFCNLTVLAKMEQFSADTHVVCFDRAQTAQEMANNMNEWQAFEKKFWNVDSYHRADEYSVDVKENGKWKKKQCRVYYSLTPVQGNFWQPTEEE